LDPSLAGTINLDPGKSELTIDVSVNIQGNLDSQGNPLVAVSAQHNYRVLDIGSGNSNITVQISNLTIEEGKVTGNGSSFSNDGRLTLINDVVQSNSAFGPPGAPYGGGGGSARGGGVYSNGERLTLTNDQFLFNTVQGGAGHSGSAPNYGGGFGGNAWGGGVY